MSLTPPEASSHLFTSVVASLEITGSFIVRVHKLQYIIVGLLRQGPRLRYYLRRCLIQHGALVDVPGTLDAEDLNKYVKQERIGLHVH